MVSGHANSVAKCSRYLLRQQFPSLEIRKIRAKPRAWNSPSGAPRTIAIGRTTNPKIGLRLTPNHWLKLRANWEPRSGHPSFPTSTTIAVTLPPSSLLVRSHFARQAAPSSSLVRVAARKLREERRHTWTAGMDLSFHELLGTEALSDLFFYSVPPQN